MTPTVTLNNLDDIRHYFAENKTPYYFISATNFNLMGMHEWVQHWTHITMVDCYDGKHPQVLNIENDHQQIFENIEDINLYLLKHPTVQNLISAQTSSQPSAGCALFLFFDERIEALCRTLNLDLILPQYRLVREIDSKIITTEIGNLAGVSSVPNVLAHISSYADLVDAAKNLGKQWVVQTAYGDSGKTTFFISSEDDYRRHANKIEAEDMVKVMRRVNCVGSAIEACATRWGTFVGPLLTELIGISNLTPYPGGWCGNELYADAFSETIRAQVLQKTQAMGDALYQRGYRGYFELDFLIDQDNEAVYLGELNARITGISAMTNMSNFSADHIPLFLFHLLEYASNIELNLNVESFNQSVLREGASGTAAQIILKYTDEPLKIITQAAVSGVYTLEADGNLLLQHTGYTRREALAENEAYLLRIMSADEYVYQGADLAILFVNNVIRQPDGTLNLAGATWTSALKSMFEFRQLNQAERSAVEAVNNPAHIKSGRDQ
ncbi:MAG: biotin carboxylase [Betaproteobacteria bacterium]|nr:biotin carboxylase [Betaproteobacteria bacterium]